MSTQPNNRPPSIPPMLGNGTSGESTGFIEQSASAMQQAATARIQSSYMMAMHNPRNIDVVREDMLRECRRPSFCAPDESKHGSSLAIYRVPRGKEKISGPTIRFAEMAQRAFRNLGVEVVALGEDGHQRLFQVICTDFETNNSQAEIVTVPKSIERSYVKDTDTVLSSRTNSQGKPVYLIIATDDEFAMKKNALTSKAKRNLILAMIPGWLIEECVNEVAVTARTKDAQDPDAAKRKLFDAFASVGIKPDQINAYFEKEGNANFTPAELEDLRGFYSGIREGITTWGDIVAAKRQLDEEPDLVAQIDELIKASGRNAASIRKLKANHAGNPQALLDFLKKEAAEKANTGGNANVEPQSTTAATSTPATGNAQADEAPSVAAGSSRPVAQTQAGEPVRTEGQQPAAETARGRNAGTTGSNGTSSGVPAKPAPVAADDKW